jgi:hypothetical protein
MVRELVREVLSDLNRSLGRQGASFDPSGAIVERLAAAGVLRNGKTHNNPIDERTTKASGIWHVANTPGDCRVHLRMGQAARHHAQDQARGIARVAADFLLNLIAYDLTASPNCLPLSHAASDNARRLHPTPPRGPNNDRPE